jgi:hypothetical protein
VLEQTPSPLGVVLKTKELLTDNRQVREQVVCLQCELRKIRCLKDLADFQRAKTTEAVPMWGGFFADDVTIHEPKWKSGDAEHARL